MLDVPCWITFGKMLRSLEASMKKVDRHVFTGCGAMKNHRMKEINTFTKKKLRLKNMDHKLVMRKQKGRKKMNCKK